VVSQRKLGISLETPVTPQLVEIISKLTYEDYDRMRHAVENLPEENFVDHGVLTQLIQTLSLQSHHGGNSLPSRVVPQEGVA
jgi:hypothetical protein